MSDVEDTQPAVTCRRCGRPIERSPASGLWWAADGEPEEECEHEPEEPEPAEEMLFHPDVVVNGCGLASPWNYGPYSPGRPDGRTHWKWAGI